ncbi:MAG: hypothetical protein IAF58_16155 [Leptolyngbya sp.]|nr:hypothetical protein [Candidatus Melainabacteria bacterium]
MTNSNFDYDDFELSTNGEAGSGGTATMTADPDQDMLSNSDEVGTALSMLIRESTEAQAQAQAQAAALAAPQGQTQVEATASTYSYGDTTADAGMYDEPEFESLGTQPINYGNSAAEELNYQDTNDEVEFSGLDPAPGYSVSDAGFVPNSLGSLAAPPSATQPSGYADAPAREHSRIEAARELAQEQQELQLQALAQEVAELNADEFGDESAYQVRSEEVQPMQAVSPTPMQGTPGVVASESVLAQVAASTFAPAPVPVVKAAPAPAFEAVAQTPAPFSVPAPAVAPTVVVAPAPLSPTAPLSPPPVPQAVAPAPTPTPEAVNAAPAPAPVAAAPAPITPSPAHTPQSARNMQTLEQMQTTAHANHLYPASEFIRNWVLANPDDDQVLLAGFNWVQKHEGSEHIGSAIKGLLEVGNNQPAFTLITVRWLTDYSHHPLAPQIVQLLNI